MEWKLETIQGIEAYVSESGNIVIKNTDSNDLAIISRTRWPEFLDMVNEIDGYLAADSTPGEVSAEQLLREFQAAQGQPSDDVPF